jgi:hypothetical protein
VQHAAHAGAALASQALAICGWTILLLTLRGGLEELSGVFGGRVSASSCASNAAMRASCAAIRSCASARRANSARISLSFSAWLSLLRSGIVLTR